MNLNETKTLSEYQEAGGTSHSSENQRILSKLVSRDVLHCCSTMVSECMKTASHTNEGEYSYDEMLELCERRYDNSDRIEEIDERLEEIGCRIFEIEEEEIPALSGDAEQLESQELVPHRKDLMKAIEKAIKLYEDEKITLISEQETLTSEKEDLEYEQENPCECLEFWAVSSWLSEELQEQGETVGELFDFTVWGRCTSGQMILMDHVIAEVAAKMGILHGQQYSWEDK